MNPSSCLVDADSFPFPSQQRPFQTARFHPTAHVFKASPRRKWWQCSWTFENGKLRKDSIGVVWKGLHPGRLTWNLQIIHLERKMIFQTFIIMFHVNLPGCKMDDLFLRDVIYEYVSYFFCLFVVFNGMIVMMISWDRTMVVIEWFDEVFMQGGLYST